jgi:hypothetical protein
VPCFTPGNFKKDATVHPSHGRPRGHRPIVRPSVRKRPYDNPGGSMWPNAPMPVAYKYSPSPKDIKSNQRPRPPISIVHENLIGTSTFVGNYGDANSYFVTQQEN